MFGKNQNQKLIYNNKFMAGLLKTKRIASVLALTVLFFTCAEGQMVNGISDAQKENFIKLLKTLPTKGEFYTDEAIDQSQKYLPVLFAFTEEDLKKLAIYPFLAISRGWCDRKPNQEYTVRHFSEINHPTLKLFWAAMLFNEKAFSPEIVRFLQDSLKSETQTKLLSAMLGPNYEDFQQRVKNYQSETK